MSTFENQARRLHGASASIVRGLLVGSKLKASSRYEFKYVLSPDQVEEVLHTLTPYLDLDPHCVDRTASSYTVRSIYWDSPRWHCFYDKCSGQQQREKFRIRTYNQGTHSPVFLESKQKHGMLCFKDKVFLCAKTLEAIEFRTLSALDPSFSPSRLLERFFYHLDRYNYLPAALVVYDRQAFSHPGEDQIRITLDYNIRTKLFPNLAELCEEDGLAYPFGRWSILEVKFSQIVPHWMQLLNARFGLKPQACSKYCNCVAHFRGETPPPSEGFYHV